METIMIIKVFSFHGWTLIISKMVERNPKHEYCASQWGEYDYSANNKKNGDYYKYKSLPEFTNKLWL